MDRLFTLSDACFNGRGVGQRDESVSVMMEGSGMMERWRRDGGEMVEGSVMMERWRRDGGFCYDGETEERWRTYLMMERRGIGGGDIIRWGGGGELL